MYPYFLLLSDELFLGLFFLERLAESVAEVDADDSFERFVRVIGNFADLFCFLDLIGDGDIFFEVRSHELKQIFLFVLVIEDGDVLDVDGVVGGSDRPFIALEVEFTLGLAEVLQQHDDDEDGDEVEHLLDVDECIVVAFVGQAGLRDPVQLAEVTVAALGRVASVLAVVTVRDVGDDIVIARRDEQDKQDDDAVLVEVKKQREA
jgi:hypothetical protein